MLLESLTNLIQYMKIRWVGFNTDQSHSWVLLQLIQIDRVHSVGNSFTHSSVLYSVRWDQMCRIRTLSSVVKYESEANASGKLDTRSDSRKGAFDTLETWMPGAVVIGLFCTYLIPIQVVTAVEGQTEGMFGSVRFTMLGPSQGL